MDYGQEIKRIVIEQAKRANVGHIGSSLSIADIVGVIFQHCLKGRPGEPDRDRFVLSKGHAALALYAALYLRGDMDEATLNSYCVDGTELALHPEHLLHGIDFSTGSLGQGITFAAGAALAAKLQKSARRVYCIISDAELNEGSSWEAFLFAAHHKLDNLTVILDFNGQQAMGRTEDILAVRGPSAKLALFGWAALDVDGHDPQALRAALETRGDAPLFLTASTVSGKGVSYMEDQLAWHYKSMNDEQFSSAMKELCAKPSSRP